MIDAKQTREALATLTRLGAMTRERRHALGLSRRVAAAQIGTSEVTVERVEAGVMPNGGHILAVLRWLIETSPEEEEATGRCRAEKDGYYCTEPAANHPGVHLAEDGALSILAAWR